jgi:transposase-like protein
MEGLFGPDRLTEALQVKVREMIVTLAEAELSEVLAALPYERSGERRGYRNGKRQRWISTGLGATAIELPRGRLKENGQEKEWQSGLIERYRRRARSVDAALLGCYLSGANGRRIRGALSCLLRGTPLSKSAISRLVGRLQSLFSDWRNRSLQEQSVVFLYLDAIALRVRIANKVSSVPVLVALGVGEDGKKLVLDVCRRAGQSRTEAAVFGDRGWEQGTQSGGGAELAWDRSSALHGA